VSAGLFAALFDAPPAKHENTKNGDSFAYRFQ